MLSLLELPITVEVGKSSFVVTLPFGNQSPGVLLSQPCVALDEQALNDKTRI